MIVMNHGSNPSQAPAGCDKAYIGGQCYERLAADRLGSRRSLIYLVDLID